jgi:hypothetical protein
MSEEKIESYDSISILVLHGGEVLISKIEEIVAEIGEPNCKLIDPFIISYEKVTQSISLSQWLNSYTTQNVFKISSDKILTMSEPRKQILDKYKNLLKK